MFFLSPFVVGDGEVRTLKLKLDRRPAPSTVFSDTETAPHVTATVVPVDPEPAPVHDLERGAGPLHAAGRALRRLLAINRSWTFGPRWGSLRSIEYGDGEAARHDGDAARVRVRAATTCGCIRR